MSTPKQHEELRPEILRSRGKAYARRGHRLVHGVICSGCGLFNPYGGASAWPDRASYEREITRVRKAARICIRCGKAPAAPQSVKCASCLAAGRDYRNTGTAVAKGRRLCGCGRQAVAVRENEPICAQCMKIEGRT